MSQKLIHCRKCAQDKPETDFYPYCLNKDGLTGQCKACRIAAKKKWDHDNPELGRLYKKRARERDPEKFRKRSIKYRELAIQRGRIKLKGSRLAFGIFATRQELETYVIEQRKTTNRFLSDIAASAGVSESTAARILRAQ